MFCEGIGNNPRVKIIDFGLAFYMKDSNKMFCKKVQAISYRAPEVCFLKSLGYGLDLWALGCIMPEIVTGVKLFDAADEEQLVCQMIHMLHVPECILPTFQKQRIQKYETKLSTGWLRFLVCYLFCLLILLLYFFCCEFLYLPFRQDVRYIIQTPC